MNLVKTGEYTQNVFNWVLSTLKNENNEVFFIAKEICEILEYSNHSKAIDDHVWEEYKLKLDNETLLSLGFNLGQRGGIVISESGMYQLVLTSKSKNAKPFQKWVYEDILPSIRKHGIYATEVTIENMINDPDFAIRVLTKLKEEKALRIEAEKKNAILMHVNKPYSATEIAKEIGLSSAKKLNDILCERKIQFKQNGTWVPYSQYSTQGYFDIKQEVLDNGRVVYHRMITQLGREFIINLLKK